MFKYFGGFRFNTLVYNYKSNVLEYIKKQNLSYSLVNFIFKPELLYSTDTM